MSSGSSPVLTSLGRDDSEIFRGAGPILAYCFTLSSSTLVFYNFVNGTSFVMDEAVFAYRIDTLHDV